MNDSDIWINKPLNIHVLATANPDQTYCSEQHITTDTELVSRWTHIHRMWWHDSGKWRVTHLSRVWRTCGLCHSPSSSDSTASVRGRVCHHNMVLFYSAECSVHLRGGETIDDCVTSNSFLSNKATCLLKVSLAAFESPSWMNALSLLCRTWKGSQTETNTSCPVVLVMEIGFEPDGV